MEERNKNENIIFTLTYKQAKTICDFKGENIDELTDEQICLLLDDIIGALQICLLLDDIIGALE